MILDHALVLPRGLDPDAPLAPATHEAADRFSHALGAAGFAEGSSRAHPGQGTANRRLFLHGLMIECLLVDDEAALDHPRGASLALGARFRDARASGVGIAVRPAPDTPGELPAPAFDSVAYRPSYLPPPLRIDVAAESRAPSAPLLFHLPFARPGPEAKDDGEPRAHPNGARRALGLRLDTVHPGTSGAWRDTLEGVGVPCTAGAAGECLHVRLDGPAVGFELDLRPLFPLRLHA